MTDAPRAIDIDVAPWTPNPGDRITLGGQTYRVDAVAMREPTPEDETDLGPIPPGGLITVLELEPCS